MKFRKAITLIETLLLIIVILLALLLFTTNMGACNGDNMNAICAANLRGIGQAMYIYVQDDPQVFPAISGPSMDGQMRVFDPMDRIGPPDVNGIPSPTVDLWTVVRANNTTPKQFICPWTTDVQDPAMWTQDFYDFASPQNLSYAYQFQHDPDRRIIGTSSEPSFPFMADSNPYIKGGVNADILDDRLSDSHGNSTNHRLRRRGQNVLSQDGHVKLVTTPAVGLYGDVAPELGIHGYDNIYTVWDTASPIYIDPGTDAPTATWCNLGGRSDACLVP
ncbi:MAG: hypothetical protein H6819_13045 [Phycisphaerales bacterium]|nr:hypothetical protein [Phycisphaerales bacterium]MCB9854437.1 hypothetical protein [Phycisphaerales bacterium]